MSLFFNRALKFIALLVSILFLATCAFTNTEVEERLNSLPYKLTKLDIEPSKDTLLNLNHHFKIELSKDIQSTNVEIPLDPSMFRGIDMNTLHLYRIDPETNLSTSIKRLVIHSPEKASIDISESGIYSIGGLPISFDARIGMRNFCDDFAQRSLINRFPLEQICLVINCPGDFAGLPVCDRCFGRISLIPAECAFFTEPEPQPIPQPQPPPPPPPEEGCPTITSNGRSVGPDISGDGRYVVFSSNATNLVERDINDQSDIFLRDRETCTTELVSVDSDEVQANSTSSGAIISQDGRFIAFLSLATNLVRNDTNSEFDVFLRDRVNGTTKIVSVNSSGIQGNDSSGLRGISNDGRYILFISESTNLSSDDRDPDRDIFLHDQNTNQTERINIRLGRPTSLIVAHWEHSTMSGDGRYVVFSLAQPSIRQQVFVLDRNTDEITQISKIAPSIDGNGPSFNPAISADGSRIAFWSVAENLAPLDSNEREDVLAAHRISGSIERASIDNSNNASTGGADYGVEDIRLNPNGRYVLFVSNSQDLTAEVHFSDDIHTGDVFRRDLVTKRTELVNKTESGRRGSKRSGMGDMDSSGDLVVFNSPSANLDIKANNGNADVFLKNMRTGDIEYISTGYVAP